MRYILIVLICLIPTMLWSQKMEVSQVSQDLLYLVKDNKTIDTLKSASAIKKPHTFVEKVNDSYVISSHLIRPGVDNFRDRYVSIKGISVRDSRFFVKDSIMFSLTYCNVNTLTFSFKKKFFNWKYKNRTGRIKYSKMSTIREIKIDCDE